MKVEGAPHQARWSGPDHLAKGLAADVAVNNAGTAELNVVEEVKSFHAQFQERGFDEAQELRDGQLCVVRSVILRGSSGNGARRSGSLRGECGRVEVVVAAYVRTMLNKRTADSK